MKSLKVEKVRVVPRHIAIIMDGNGRWAKLKGKNRLYGHRKGVESVRKIIKYSAKVGVKYLTLYTFSTENWNRPKNEVNGLMKLFSKLLEHEIPELYKNNVRILFTGRRNRLPKELLDKMDNAEEVTKNNTGLTLILAFDYGGRQEIVDTCKEVCRKLKLNQIEKLDDEEFSKHLYLPDVPDPDLVIRTSGEFRISNFLLWQTAYSEFYFTEVLWPDFDEEEFDKALDDYSKRERRFGKI
ncbi:MAG: Isoprenyl transferase [candidate division TA06 bacterium 32_111]|uniref:Isoprenyl transferase n=2 Tax=Bacteria candidate phyla TaxID=1783234 RepID=A0A117M6M4_UNCT6|nr:MAG: Isoprenyl transferase [candidate division TA06 bacterium 32_111]KUK87281.1 MAG: Isoprenyl transferase [candidate division TA06 bacterium 34_109]HAF07585.1 isoprenyl transferase [candidate division WOR-3 bacterium]HCP16136.1 isoprenyl transferase [candidate division WOR-3 bacterium]